jgi:protein gp37
MSANTTIEWCDHTFNPWEGCQKVSPGCDNCYAEARNARFAGGTAINWGPGAPRRRTSAANWSLPKRWNAQADAFMAQHGRRQRVFCASLADVFDNAVDPQWRADLFKLIADTPNLDWLLLTKRIGNVARMIPFGWQDFRMPPNIWIGATIVNQAEADRDIPKLLEVPARVRFLSMEPLAGQVNISDIPDPAGGICIKPLAGLRWKPISGPAPGCIPESHPKIDWVIVGGESGPNARPMHPGWARSLRDQCEAAGVPFLFKQWGEWMPTIHEGDTVKLVFEKGAPHGPDQPAFHDWPDGQGAARVGKKAAGRLLDGRTWDGFPS